MVSQDTRNSSEGGSSASGLLVPLYRAPFQSSADCTQHHDWSTLQGRKVRMDSRSKRRNQVAKIRHTSWRANLISESECDIYCKLWCRLRSSAEREGFEPSIQFVTVFPLSRRTLSATQPPLQVPGTPPSICRSKVMALHGWNKAPGLGPDHWPQTGFDPS